MRIRVLRILLLLAGGGVLWAATGMAFWIEPFVYYHHSNFSAESRDGFARARLGPLAIRARTIAESEVSRAWWWPGILIGRDKDEHDVYVWIHSATDGPKWFGIHSAQLHYRGDDRLVHLVAKRQESVCRSPDAPTVREVDDQDGGPRMCLFAVDDLDIPGEVREFRLVLEVEGETLNGESLSGAVALEFRRREWLEKGRTLID